MKKNSGRKFTKSRKNQEDAIEKVRRYRELVVQEYRVLENGLVFITNDRKGIQDLLIKCSENKELIGDLVGYKREVSKQFEEKYGQKPNMNFMEIQLGSIVNKIDQYFIDWLFDKNLRKSEIENVTEATSNDRTMPFHKWTKFKFETFDIDKYIEAMVNRAKDLYNAELNFEECKTQLAEVYQRYDAAKKTYEEDKERLGKVEDLNTLTGFLV